MSNSQTADKDTAKEMDGLPPSYTWSKSFQDWWKQAVCLSDKIVEENLLSSLPFFPDSDGKRQASLIDTDIGDGNHIHELYVENTEKPEGTAREIVLIHGYAASLGLFIENFDALTSIPGVKLHAIDLLGFGFSSRPKFPKLGTETVEDISKCEDWFLDAIEKWRKSRNINRFTLIGHSFGAYLSCAYALKYNKQPKDTTGQSENLIDKLVVVSPVGLERNKTSLLKDADLPEEISEGTRAKGNEEEPEIQYQNEMEADQNELTGRASAEQKQDKVDSTEEEKSEESFRLKLIRTLWQRNFSPISLVRSAGPFKSKLLYNWSRRRFAHIYDTDPTKFENLHAYMYRVCNSPGSGEYALTRIIGYGLLPRMPLLDRCPINFVNMNLPTLWMYGDRDWMNKEAGEEMVQEINKIANKNGKSNLAEFTVTPRSGHHIYLDNPDKFFHDVNKFIEK